MTTVSVIILNWNGRHYLERCLRSVFAQTYQPFEVVLVDNGSTDGSAEWVAATFPQVRLICNRTNWGFAAANNQAIRATDSELVALLNNDTVVEPGWLQALVSAMNTKATIGMCASKMLLASQPDTVDSAGIAIDRAGLAWGISGRAADLNQPRPVFGASAGAALYRRAMLDDIGLFDESFFLYLEDVDLAWRAQWGGWEAIFVPEAVVYHVHSGTARTIHHVKSRLLGRNKIWLLCKNYPFPQILWNLPLIMWYEGASLAYALVQRRLGSALLGRLEALGKAPMMVAKRKQVTKRVSADFMYRQLSPIEGPGAVLRRYLHVQGPVQTRPNR
ncbi:MAG TPA: glycosyltransferase family 2 protein [Caldilineaceae bacterium]|nr:glycosyltransferase family 2 protein [Caldilineaceae bacterium]